MASAQFHRRWETRMSTAVVLPPAEGVCQRITSTLWLYLIILPHVPPRLGAGSLASPAPLC